MKTYFANAIAEGAVYIATITDFGNGTCAEFVSKSGEMGCITLAEEDFPTANLGSASKQAYARSILASAIFKDAKTKEIQWLA